MHDAFPGHAPQEARPERLRSPHTDAAPAGPLKSLAIEANHIAQRADGLVGIARDLELMLIGPYPEPATNGQGRAIPQRETFTEQLGGSQRDALEALNAVEAILCRIRQAL